MPVTGVERLRETGAELGETLRESVEELVEEIKPRLCGWLHLATVPLALAAGIVLVVLSPGGEAKVGAIAFAASSVLLFTVSATYHTQTWQVRARSVLQRFDHASIFLLIAGTYTAFALLLLDDRDAAVLLAVVWGGALLGVACRLVWAGAPRWAFVPAYLTLGWAAAFWAAEFIAAAGAAVLTLMLVGGGLYTLGGVVYSLQRPDPFPRWFGFHEVFHSLVVAAFVVHYVGISIVSYSLR